MLVSVNSSITFKLVFKEIAIVELWLFTLLFVVVQRLLLKSVIYCSSFFLERRRYIYWKTHVNSQRRENRIFSAIFFLLLWGETCFLPFWKEFVDFFLITMNESSLRTDIYDHRNVIKIVTEIFMVYDYVSLYIAMNINIIRM